MRMTEEWRQLMKQAAVLSVEHRPEACLGCGFEHNCSLHGCAVINRLIEIAEQHQLSAVVSTFRTEDDQCD